MKKCCSFVLAALLATSLFAVSAKAKAHTHRWEGLTCAVCGEKKEVLSFGDWQYVRWDESDEITIWRYAGNDEIISIPDQIDGFPVTSIGDDAFTNCTSPTDISIPDSITTIESNPFVDCSAKIRVSSKHPVLATYHGVLFEKESKRLISFPSGSESSSYEIPQGILEIGNSAFSGCKSLTDITIPDSITSIGDFAFSYCDKLTDITIPNSVTTIGSNPFVGCPATIHVSSKHPALATFHGALFEKEGKRLVSFSYGEESSSYEIPQGILEIGDYTFSDCKSLTDITIPDSVTSIGDYAFRNCRSLTGITIPDGVTSIGDYAFWGCASLTDITIPYSVTTIGNNPFSLCPATIRVSSKHPALATFQGALFEKESKRLISFFGAEESSSYEIPQGILEIGDFAFGFCDRLTDITIPDSVTSIGNYAFHFCNSLTDVTIPDSVTSIGSYAFSWCSSLTDITIPDSVTTIGNNAFSGCGNLTVSLDGDSCAEAYCIKNNINYVYSETLDWLNS